MTRLGVVFLPQFPPEQLASVARTADAAGLEELWLWEDCFLQGGMSSATAALAWTERLTVGVGVLPMPLRNVALTAMEIANLARMFPGRSRIGVGHGVQDWMGQVGERVASPLTLFTEYVPALQRLLDGETVSVQGRYVQLRDVALDWPPTDRVPVLAAASGPKTLALSGALAAGTVLGSGTTPDDLRQARAAVDAAAPAAGHQVIIYLICATGPDGRTRAQAELQHWPEMRDRALDDVTVSGDEFRIAAGIRRWVEAGADTVVLQPTRDEPDLEGFVSFVAERVRPLI